MRNRNVVYLIEDNLKKFGVEYPIFFKNIIPDDICDPLPEIGRLTEQDIRNASGHIISQYKYVILSDGKLIISEPYSKLIPLDSSEFAYFSKCSPRKNTIKYNGKFYNYLCISDKEYVIYDTQDKMPKGRVIALAHPEIAGLEPVAVAGDFYVLNGAIAKIDARTGHYLCRGEELEIIVKHVFSKFGFPEVKIPGCFNPEWSSIPFGRGRRPIMIYGARALKNIQPQPINNSNSENLNSLANRNITLLDPDTNDLHYKKVFSESELRTISNEALKNSARENFNEIDNLTILRLGNKSKSDVPLILKERSLPRFRKIFNYDYIYGANAEDIKKLLKALELIAHSKSPWIQAIYKEFKEIVSSGRHQLIIVKERKSLQGESESGLVPAITRVREKGLNFTLIAADFKIEQLAVILQNEISHIVKKWGGPLQRNWNIVEAKQAITKDLICLDKKAEFDQCIRLIREEADAAQKIAVLNKKEIHIIGCIDNSLKDVNRLNFQVGFCKTVNGKSIYITIDLHFDNDNHQSLITLLQKNNICQSYFQIDKSSPQNNLQEKSKVYFSKVPESSPVVDMETYLEWQQVLTEIISSQQGDVLKLVDARTYTFFMAQESLFGPSLVYKNTKEFCEEIYATMMELEFRFPEQTKLFTPEVWSVYIKNLDPIHKQIISQSEIKEISFQLNQDSFNKNKENILPKESFHPSDFQTKIETKTNQNTQSVKLKRQLRFYTSVGEITCQYKNGYFVGTSAIAASLANQALLQVFEQQQNREIMQLVLASLKKRLTKGGLVAVAIDIERSENEFYDSSLTLQGKLLNGRKLDGKVIIVNTHTQDISKIISQIIYGGIKDLIYLETNSISGDPCSIRHVVDLQMARSFEAQYQKDCLHYLKNNNGQIPLSNTLEYYLFQKPQEEFEKYFLEWDWLVKRRLSKTAQVLLQDMRNAYKQGILELDYLRTLLMTFPFESEEGVIFDEQTNSYTVIDRQLFDKELIDACISACHIRRAAVVENLVIAESISFQPGQAVKLLLHTSALLDKEFGIRERIANLAKANPTIVSDEKINPPSQIDKPYSIGDDKGKNKPPIDDDKGNKAPVRDDKGSIPPIRDDKGNIPPQVPPKAKKYLPAIRKSTVPQKVPYNPSEITRVVMQEEALTINGKTKSVRMWGIFTQKKLSSGVYVFDKWIEAGIEEICSRGTVLQRIAFLGKGVFNAVKIIAPPLFFYLEVCKAYAQDPKRDLSQAIVRGSIRFAYPTAIYAGVAFVCPPAAVALGGISLLSFLNPDQSEKEVKQMLDKLGPVALYTSDDLALAWAFSQLVKKGWRKIEEWADETANTKACQAFANFIAPYVNDNRGANTNGMLVVGSGTAWTTVDLRSTLSQISQQNKADSLKPKVFIEFLEYLRWTQPYQKAFFAQAYGKFDSKTFHKFYFQHIEKVRRDIIHKFSKQNNNANVTSSSNTNNSQNSSKQNKQPTTKFSSPEINKNLPHDIDISNVPNDSLWRVITNDNEKCAATSFELDTTQLNKMLTQLDVNVDDLLPTELSSEAKETSKRIINNEYDASQQEAKKPSFKDNLKITDVSFGPMIGNCAGIIATLASGAKVSVGGSVSSQVNVDPTIRSSIGANKILVGLEVPLSAGFTTALAAGSPYAIPIAAIMIAAWLVHQKYTKKVAAKINYDLKQDQKNIASVNPIIDSINAIRKAYNTGKISKEEFLKELQNRNWELALKERKSDKLSDYASDHRQFAAVYKHVLNSHGIQQLIINNLQIIEDQKLLGNITNKIEKQTDKSIKNLVEQLKSFSNRSLLNKAEHLEAMVLRQFILKTLENSSKIEDLQCLQELGNLKLGQSLAMPTVAPLNPPDPNSFKNKEDEYHAMKRISELASDHEAFKKLVQGENNGNIDEAKKTFETTAKKARRKLHEYKLKGTIIDPQTGKEKEARHCGKYYEHFIATLEKNVNEAYAKRQNVNTESLQPLFHSGEIGIITTKVALNALREGSAKLNNQTLDVAKDLAFKQANDGAEILLKSGFFESHEKNQPEIDLEEQCKNITKIYKEYDGSYILFETIQAFSKILIKLDDKQESVTQTDFDEAYCLAEYGKENSKNENIKKSCENFIKNYKSYGGSLKISEDTNTLYKLMEDNKEKGIHILRKNLTEAYHQAKKLKANIKGKTVDEQVYNLCEAAIAGSYNYATTLFTEPVTKVAIYILSDQSKRFGKWKEIAQTASAIHGLLPSLVPDSLHLPGAILWYRDFTSLKNIMIENLLKHFSEYKKDPFISLNWYAKVGQLGITAASAIISITSLTEDKKIEKKLNYVANAVNFIDKAATVKKVFDYWGTNKIFDLSPKLIDLVFEAPFKLYEFFNSGLPANKKDFWPWDYLKEFIAKSGLTTLGNLTTNEHYYLLKDVLKIFTMFLLRKRVGNAVAWNYIGSQTFITAYNYFFHQYKAYICGNISKNAQHYWGLNDFQQAHSWIQELKLMLSIPKVSLGGEVIKETKSLITQFEHAYLSQIRLTKADGDCLFHAVWGKWDKDEKMFVCPNVTAYRDKMALTIRDCKGNSKLLILVQEAIKAIVMENKNTNGLKLKDAQRRYRLENDTAVTDAAWKKFEEKLKLPVYSEVIKSIENFCKTYCVNKQKLSFTYLRDKFSICYNEDGDKLKKLISSNADLSAAYDEYHKQCELNFNWNEILNDQNIINEYADFVAKSGQWMLPVEAQILAMISNVNIQLYTKDIDRGDTLLIDLGLFNTEAEKKVIICFDGVNHYQRMISDEELNKLESEVVEEQKPNEDKYQQRDRNSAQALLQIQKRTAKNKTKEIFEKILEKNSEESPQRSNGGCNIL